MNRRGFLKAAQLAAVAVVPASVGAASAVLTPRPRPLPPAVNNQVLTAESWNALVDRVNQLTATR